jgi:hypothetical protein
MLIELVSDKPEWTKGLAVALTRPPGIPERRSDQDPWKPQTDRPRRITDDLAWLREALDDPGNHGLKELAGTAAHRAWDLNGADPVCAERLRRLEDRQVLMASGFLLHDDTPLEELAS